MYALNILQQVSREEFELDYFSFAVKKATRALAISNSMLVVQPSRSMLAPQIYHRGHVSPFNSI